LTDPAAFVRANTAVASPPLVPEIRLHLASEITPIWQASEEMLRTAGVPPPYWAFAWPGGQALARHILDHPELVRGKRVLDFAAGCGIGAVAAMRAGAAEAAANDIDPFAAAACRLNAALNGVDVRCTTEDLTGATPEGCDVVLAGDVCYERPMAERAIAWLRRAAKAGALVLIADPGRAYKPKHGLVEIARYDVPTTLELEDRDVRACIVARLA
jgi:predicted nicotinamide N-methyase